MNIKNIKDKFIVYLLIRDSDKTHRSNQMLIKKVDRLYDQINSDKGHITTNNSSDLDLIRFMRKNSDGLTFWFDHDEIEYINKKVRKIEELDKIEEEYPFKSYSYKSPTHIKKTKRFPGAVSKKQVV